MLNLNFNGLSGCIPQSYTTANYPSLNGMLLAENPQLTGCVPPSWKELTSPLFNSYTILRQSNPALISNNCTPDPRCAVEPTKPDKRGLSGGAIAGIVVACVVVFLVVLFFIVFLCCRRTHKKGSKTVERAVTSNVLDDARRDSNTSSCTPMATAGSNRAVEGRSNPRNQKTSTTGYSYYDDLY
ncbi:hypothetical protein ADEAN_001026800 [Angomonas deanei]|uniref:Leucine rich repeat n=1 Tax=Angomonas deanei TaxID=59799 RepID=A0A7G2CUH7_9TRYP|nr:hypothetical protein ADEAN_001026800 [Angomonas deanei]